MKRNASALITMVAVVLLLATGGIVSAESPQMVANLSSFFTFPPEIKAHWFSSDVLNDPGKGRCAYIFGRNFADSTGVNYQASVGFIFETLPPIVNNFDDEMKKDFVAEYSRLKLKEREKSRLPIIIDKTYSPQDKLFSWKYALGYKGRVMVNGKEHTIYLVHGLFYDNGRAYGTQVVIDSLTPVFPQLESEFTAMLAQIGGGQ